MKILFTICGRAGSKGIKNKNLKKFLGLSLPFYTLSVIDMFIKKNKNIYCDIVLNTDSQELSKLIKNEISIPVYFINRDQSLGEDNTPKTLVIQNSYVYIKEKFSKNYDVIIDLDITSPLRTLSDLENLVLKYQESNADVVFSVTESRRNPYFNMVMKAENGYNRVIRTEFNARQEAPEIFDMNASMYAYKPSFLISGKHIFDSKCDIIKMLDTAVLDIDHENDLELMQVIAEYLYKNNQDFKNIKDNIENILIS